MQMPAAYTISDGLLAASSIITHSILMPWRVDTKRDKECSLKFLTTEQWVT